MTLLFAWLALRPASHEPAPVALVRTAVVPAAPMPAVAALPPEMPAPRGIRVHGVLQRGEQSHALLSVEGAAAHVVRIGEPVAQGWSLAAVEPDHVLLAHGPARARIDVSYSVRSGNDPSAASAEPRAVAVGMRGRALVKDEPLPGFVKADPTAPTRQMNPATNRRFLEDHQKRMAAGKP